MSEEQDRADYQEYLDYLEYQKHIAAASKPQGNVANQIETGARGLLEGATAGISEPVISGINAGVGSAIDYATGNPVNWDSIKQAYAEDVARRKRLASENPLINSGTSIIGAIAPSPINVGSKIAKGVESIVSVPKILQGGGIVKGALKGAASGALGGAGYEAVKQAAERPSGFVDSDSAIDDIMKSAVLGGKLGGAVGAVAGVPATIRTAKDAASSAGKNWLSSKFGVSRDSIDSYLQNPERIRNAKNIDELYTEVSNAVEPMVTAVREGTATRDQAAAILQNAREMAKESLRMQKFDAEGAAKQADQILKQAVTRSRSVAAPSLVDAVSDLKNAVIERSGAAFDKLEKSKQLFPTRVLKAAVQKQINGITNTGTGVTETGSAALKSLTAFRERMESLPPNLSMKQLKAIVQGLDKDIGWTDNAGQFMDAASKNKSVIRHALDQYLKRNVKGYADAMKPVAEDAALLSEVSRIAGTEKQALSTLSALDGKGGAPARKIIGRLERRLGKSFIKSTAESGQPEFVQSANANAKALSMKGPNWINDSVESATAKQADKLARSEQALASAESELAPFQKISPNAKDGFSGVQSRLNTALRGKDIETQTMFQALSKKTGKDFVQAIDDLRVKEAFEKGDMNGSKNVNYWAILGGMAGLLTGGPLGAAGGAGIGAGLGKYMDRFGPATARTILDLTLKAKNLPSPADIAKWPIPKAARTALSDELSQVFTPEVIESLGRNARGLGGAAVRPRNGSPVPIRMVSEKEKEKSRLPAQQRQLRLKALGD